jgi:hypothetical protein
MTNVILVFWKVHEMVTVSELNNYRHVLNLSYHCVFSVILVILFLQFDYKNKVLAVGGTDNALEFWLPCSS